jgi:membrane protease YdiL (CAAX protease family)
VSLLVAISLIAGVTEEAAFRGYVISGIQPPFGWPAAIGVSGFLFYIAHVFSHPELTLAFLPYFALGSIVYGALLFLTRSIWPGVILHVLLDALGLPVLLVVRPSLTRSRAVIAGGLLVAAPAFRRLAAVARLSRAEAPPHTRAAT